MTEKSQHRSERIQRSDSGSRYAKCRIDLEGNLIVADPALARKFNRSAQRQTLLAFLSRMVSAFSDVDPMYGPVVPPDEILSTSGAGAVISSVLSSHHVFRERCEWGPLAYVSQQSLWFSDQAANNRRIEMTSEFPTRLRRAVGRLGRILQYARTEAGLTPSQYEVLGRLMGWGPLRLGELASEGLHPTMLSLIAGKLETEGLAIRTADTEDGRVASRRFE